MLLRHSAIYFVVRGGPALINFLALAIYTRLLPPEDYGRYALLLAGVGLFNVVFFQWLRLSLLRFLPAHQEASKPLLSTVLACFLFVLFLTGTMGIGLAFLWPDSSWRYLFLLGTLLLWAEAWHELNLELFRSKLQPARYGFMSFFRAACALGIGALLALRGLGAYAPLIGLFVGAFLAPLLWARAEWRGVGLSVTSPLAAEFLRYGIPLTASFALNFVVSTSDRFLIAWFLGEAHAGQYAAAYDLAQQPLGLFMAVVSLAGYPLAVRALEEKGVKAAAEQMQRSGSLLFGIGLPAAAGMVVLTPGIVEAFLGVEFRVNAREVLPWVVVAVLLSGLRAYHFDLAFQLGKRTGGQVWVAGVAAAANVVLNLWWIPHWKLVGAAVATLVSYVLALLISVVLGRHILWVGVPWRDWFKVGLACVLMVFVLTRIGRPVGLGALGACILTGAFVYAAAVVLLNVGGCRLKLYRYLTNVGRIRQCL